MNPQKPVIAITMGDPAGIGPELVIKLLKDPASFTLCRPLVIGDPEVMQRAADLLDTGIPWHVISSFASATFQPPQVDLLCPAELHVGEIPVGGMDPNMGQASAVCLKAAVDLSQTGAVRGIVSAPISKEAFHLAGYPYRDELGYLAKLTSSPDTAIIGVMKQLWVATVTEHIPLREVAEKITTESVLRLIRLFHQVLVARGESSPRIAVAALNPHAGDGGLLGREEIEAIRPAVEAARADGLQVTGPIPADVVYAQGLRGEYDGVVGMYHDQANIARKLQPKEESVTLYMGLPFACGTTAHGTAFDIAWQGKADPGSLQHALRWVSRLAASSMYGA